MSKQSTSTPEIIEDASLFTTRLEVPGGWLYRSFDKSHSIMGMCFVPNNGYAALEAKIEREKKYATEFCDLLEQAVAERDELVIRAVNAHEELIAALDRAHLDIIRFLNEGDFKRHVVWDAGYILDALSKARTGRGLEYVCSYCEAPWGPVRETIVAAVDDEHDEVFEGDMCPSCGEFNGKAPARAKGE